MFLPPWGNYILIQVTEDLNCDTAFSFILKGTCLRFSFFVPLNSTVAESEEKWYSANYIFMEPSLFPCLLLSGLCYYGLYNYLIIKWWRSFYSTVCKVLYLFYEGDFLNYPVTPFLRLSLLALSPSVFQTSDAVCPMIQNSLQCPPADELKVFLWHSRPWWRIQRQEANKKIFSLRKWERKSRSVECTRQAKLRFFFFAGCQKWWTILTKCYRQWHLKATSIYGRNAL